MRVRRRTARRYGPRATTTHADAATCGADAATCDTVSRSLMFSSLPTPRAPPDRTRSVRRSPSRHSAALPRVPCADRCSGLRIPDEPWPRTVSRDSAPFYTNTYAWGAPAYALRQKTPALRVNRHRSTASGAGVTNPVPGVSVPRPRFAGCRLPQTAQPPEGRTAAVDGYPPSSCFELSSRGAASTGATSPAWQATTQS